MHSLGHGLYSLRVVLFTFCMYLFLDALFTQAPPLAVACLLGLSAVFAYHFI
jgi:hypothetical protein